MGILRVARNRTEESEDSLQLIFSFLKREHNADIKLLDRPDEVDDCYLVQGKGIPRGIKDFGITVEEYGLDGKPIEGICVIHIT